MDNKPDKTGSNMPMGLRFIYGITSAGKGISESEARQLRNLRKLALTGNPMVDELFSLWLKSIRRNVYLPPDEWELFQGSLRRGMTIPKLRAEAIQMRKDGYPDVADRLDFEADLLFTDAAWNKVSDGRLLSGGEVYQIWRLKSKGDVVAAEIYEKSVFLRKKKFARRRRKIMFIRKITENHPLNEKKEESNL